MILNLINFSFVFGAYFWASIIFFFIMTVTTITNTTITKNIKEPEKRAQRVTITRSGKRNGKKGALNAS